MSPATLAIRYTIIALSASALNLLLQAAISWLYQGPLAVEASMVLATGLVLPLKYSIERRVIFEFQPASLLHDAKLFYLYTMVSVFTVLIFWCTEYAFHLIFRDDAMRYIGGAVGLAISFYSKYRLDKQFVFVRPSQTGS
jgi:positive regulator of sigma E activity